MFSARCSCWPAAAILLVFLAYPLSLGFWLGLTDTPIGAPGRFVGLANFVSLAHDLLFWLSVFNTLFYTVVASALKFSSASISRSCSTGACRSNRCCAPSSFAVRRADGAFGDRVLVDLRSAVLDRLLGADQVRAHRPLHRLSRPALARPLVGDRRECLARHPLRDDHLAAGLQTISPSLYEAATLDGASALQRFRFVTLPVLSPIIAVVMTFSVLMTFTDFQLIYTLTEGGPINATQLMATLSFRAGDHRRPARRGRGDRRRHGAVPARGHPVQLFRLAAAALATGLEGLSDGQAAATEGMDYLERLPRRLFTSICRSPSSSSCCCFRSTG